MQRRFFQKRNATMKSVALPAAVALILCSPFLAQDLRAQTAKPAPSIRQTHLTVAVEREADEDENAEQEGLAREVEKMRRDHSDEKGRVRPDLFDKANAHVQRMGIADQIGANPKDAEPVEKP
jgi:hypothetical protein